MWKPRINIEVFRWLAWGVSDLEVEDWTEITRDNIWGQEWLQLVQMPWDNEAYLTGRTWAGQVW